MGCNASKQEGNVSRSAPGGGSKAKGGKAKAGKSKSKGFASATSAPVPDGGACYLVYEPDSSGRLVEHYSKTAIEGAIGRWTPGKDKKIAGFKFTQNHGKVILIGNCSGGVAGRKAYCAGWNQFVKSAKLNKGEIMFWEPLEGVKGLPVDVWLYTDDNRPGFQSMKLETGVAVTLDKMQGVATLPKDSDFYEGVQIDLFKWLDDGNSKGASIKF
ncbi:unnamed protein product [Cylindrotheca closterium]|uniref:Immune mapped protein 2 N-terminal domain-containing protein n=1 Tax=Cylindrotheca closterium TaxID=2856 RepID=A0AAD2FH29_9STRA|nr:unnamed protein product [Cylindrotheca closterium]